MTMITSAGQRCRLLPPALEEPEDLAAYLARGGHAPGSLSGPMLLDELERAGLRGRGGAGFPTHVKCRAVAERPGPRFVIANGAEAEPTSAKDRQLLRRRPHLVLEGLSRVSTAVAASRAYVYVCDPVDAATVERALAERPPLAVEVVVVEVPRSYVAGEETAVVRAVGGGAALPTVKPPRPFEAGLEGRPTLVLNVETLAHLAQIATRGSSWFRELGTEESPGTFLATIGGDVAHPGVYELELGMPLGEALAVAGGSLGRPNGFLMGGYFGGLLGPELISCPLSYEALRARSSSLGCGAITVLAGKNCPIAAAAQVMDFFSRENARQCGPCVRGTAAMSEVLARLRSGGATQADLDNLARWSRALPGRGACATLDGAAALARSLLTEFPALVALHLEQGCANCRD